MERGGSLDGVELTLLVRWILIVGTRRTVPPSLIFVGSLCQVVTLVSGNRLLELDILRMEALIFLLETLGHGLKSDVTFDLALFVELDACLKLSKLRLLALSEGALRDSFRLYQVSTSRFKSTDRSPIPVLDAPTVDIRYLNPNRLSITED